MSAVFSPVRARTGISLFFFTNGAMMAGIMPRYPEIKAAFELSNTAFGFMVAVGPIASVAASALPAPLIRRFGAQPVALAWTCAMAFAMMLAGFAPHFFVFALALAIAGFSDALVDSAQNVHGVRVEDAYGKTIINSLHALWSLGATTGGVVGAWAASQHIPLSIHLSAVALTLIGLATIATVLGRLPGNPRPVAATESEVTPSGKLPTGAWAVIVPLALLAIAGVLTEDVASNWAALYVVQVVGATAAVGGIGYTVMLGSQFIGRLLGDPATDRWGSVAVIRMGGVMIAVGGVLIIAFPVLPVVMVGYALCGYGCATIVPTAYAAAGRLPGLPEGAGITYVSWLLRMGFVASSPFIGAVSDVTSLRVALGLLAVGGLAIIYLARVVRPTEPSPAASA
ncbi:MAG: MFS transporter [Propioniciclava sp.]|uniref:MFS transporter n=1 Tax=Propioniciclava sp. TaxID=2038686 RepID=UPI0039E651BA